MAESAPLTAAHVHARKAAHETKLIHWEEAVEEHQLAAADFARASKTTTDNEALRILNLLEQQHRKLAALIKADDALKPSHSAGTKAEVPLPTPRTNATVTSGLPVTNATSSAIAAARLERQTQDSSPSLARDIASRRGIPPSSRSQPSAAAQARARQVSPEAARRDRPVHTSNIPPSVVDSQAQLAKSRIVSKTSDDEGFTKFYSNITSGTMSKLTSVLAYAGLPLSSEEKALEQNTALRSSNTVKANNDPDVNKLFSKAALSALEDAHRQQGSNGNFFGPAESFYVVQKGGGTFSYADIAKAHQQHQLQSLSGIDEEDEDSFVDAREIPGPNSPRHSRQPSSHQKHSLAKTKTSEELELENSTLKATLEMLAQRLADFERHAQDANMEALNQSMLSMRGVAHHDDGSRDRLRTLEQQIESQLAEKQEQEALIAKQKEQIKKYHAKWEEVKNSARERRKKEKEKANDESGRETPTVSI